MLQKLDAFYRRFKRFRPFKVYILHFSFILLLISLQLILVTVSSPLTEVKQLQGRLCLDGCPCCYFFPLFFSLSLNDGTPGE